MKRCFELRHSGHDKFWTVEVVGCHYLATFGRVGSRGQTQVKAFLTADRALGEAHKMIREKTNKGYTEVAAPIYPGAPPALLASLEGQAPVPEPLPPIDPNAPIRRIRRDW